MIADDSLDTDHQKLLIIIKNHQQILINHQLNII